MNGTLRKRRKPIIHLLTSEPGFVALYTERTLTPTKQVSTTSGTSKNTYDYQVIEAN